ncbi:cellulose biosynthesis protein BcsD [Pectobacteriaceae bacterium C52]|uniref:Cellulose synthase n=1 Tax=Serratia sp. (strain ATCC 39006) TaxID=104623 RepID=A0A2I5TF80_SERS3|nr:cellulose biosynthesis protein BcsD [Serratia sp. ATCC 39006]AUG98910.1 cellulose synthase [Serratia sp. ATCC 39006]AUH03225.1 cellulose synthase [Serratia sp. ATCC 39006]WJV62467.1 cellulose biosynthesis protein BcsD [Pectobacteriaceae bacterium C52]
MSERQQQTLDYYRQQQFQPGWISLLNVVVGGMIDNAGEQDATAFLRQTGEQLAEHYPLKEAVTVKGLECEINRILAMFHWGCVDIQPGEQSLEIFHLELPDSDNGLLKGEQWRMAMGAVLQGLYSRWLSAQNGNDHILLSCEKTDSDVVLLFRYQNAARGTAR